jgi:hypothetical protein
MAKGKGDLGKAVVGLGRALVRRVTSKKPAKQIVREVTEAARGTTRRAPSTRPRTRIKYTGKTSQATTRQLPQKDYTTMMSAVDDVGAPRRVLPSVTSPRVRTQAVSRTDRGTVSRVGDAAAKQADKAAETISGARQVGRRALFGPRAGTLKTGVPLTAGGKAMGLTGRVLKIGIPAGLGVYGLNLRGGGDGYEFIPEDFVAGGGVVPSDSDATADELEAYERISREQVLAETGQIDPFATDAMGEGGLGMGGGMGAGSEEDIYGNLRSGFGDYAKNLRGYGTAKGAGLRSTYGDLSEQALKDAAEAEAIAQAASGDIGRIGQDYSAAATQDIQSPGAGGPTELTGLTPVSGESYDIPGRIADTSQIAADYVLRDLNLSRDDLNFMSGMAQQMGPAYEAQLNENLAMLIADKQFELEQSIFSQQAEDMRADKASRQQSISDFYDRQLALELMKANRAPKATRPVSAEQINAGITNLSADRMQTFMQNFNKLMESDGGRKTLRANGINPDDPNAFSAYLAQEVRAELAATGE